MTSGVPGRLADGSEVILIVDDDAFTRAPIVRSLRTFGYFVLEAGNGEEALRVMQEHHAPVHLVISDVVMPEMNGAELVSFLRDSYPGLRILFISGYTAGHIEAGGERLQGVELLPKPFSPSQLLAKVREILDADWAPEDSR